MTDADHCYQNAITKRINGILKDEFNLDAEFLDMNQLRTAVDQTVDVTTRYERIGAWACEPLRRCMPRLPDQPVEGKVRREVIDMSISPQTPVYYFYCPSEIQRPVHL